MLKSFNFLTIVFVLLISFFYHSKASASCTSPSGKAGEFAWMSGTSNVQWCNDTNWVDARVSTLLSCSGVSSGTINFDNSTGALSYCDGSFWQSMKGVVTGNCIGTDIGKINYRSNGLMLEYCDGVFWNAMTIASAPVLNSFAITSGTSPFSINNIPFSVSSSSTDTGTLLTEFCIKYTLSATAPSTPNVNDSCWVPYNNPTPGKTPAANINFSNFYYSIGFTPGRYYLYVWAKTGANQISSLTNSGAGTLGIDKIELDYQPVPPPVLINSLATVSDNPSVPVAISDLVIPAGQSVYIKWKLSAAGGLSAGPISLYYTTDEINYTLISSGLTNGVNGSCTIDGVTYTGCYKWTNGSPTSSYYKIRVVGQDLIGMTTFSPAPPINTSPYNPLAGNTDTGLGGSASSAIFFNTVSDEITDIKSLVVANDGTMFVRDNYRGILKISPTTGTVTSFIPSTGTAIDGAIGTATLRSAFARLTIDYQNNLIIYDYDKIRKVNLTTNQVTTIIGGGSDTTSGSAALSFSLSCNASNGSYCPIIPAPNGDIYFFRLSAYSSTPAGGSYIWKYQVSDQKIYSIIPSGTGVTGSPSFPIDTSSLAGFSFEAIPSTGVITRFYATFRQLPCVGCGLAFYPAQLDLSTGVSMGTGYIDDAYHVPVTSLTGKMFHISQRNLDLQKYDSATNSFITVLGTGVKGSCSDGTIATACNVNLQDAFVTAQEKIYFLDNGLIRMIDENNKVQTLFGQRKSYGDGGLARSARFNNIVSIGVSPTGNIGVIDRYENIFREFTPGGTITTLIGNGSVGNVIDGSIGTNTSFAGGYWGNNFQFYYTASNDIYLNDYTYILKYDRSTSTINRIIGMGGTSYVSADGLTGANVAIDGYSPQLLGFNGTKLLMTSNKWNGSAHQDIYTKAYDVTDSYRQSSLIGTPGLDTSSYSADGTALSSSMQPSEFGNRLMSGSWDTVDQVWYFISRLDNTRVRKLIPNGTIETLGYLPRGATSWTFVRNASSEKVVYYCSAGRMYKYNFDTGVDTTLFWPSSTISCVGSMVARHPTRNSIIFPIAQNGLRGISEIIDTP